MHRELSRGGGRPGGVARQRSLEGSKVPKAEARARRRTTARQRWRTLGVAYEEDPQLAKVAFWRRFNPSDFNRRCPSLEHVSSGWRRRSRPNDAHCGRPEWHGALSRCMGRAARPSSCGSFECARRPQCVSHRRMGACADLQARAWARWESVSAALNGAKRSRRRRRG